MPAGHGRHPSRAFAPHASNATSTTRNSSSSYKPAPSDNISRDHQPTPSTRASPSGGGPPPSRAVVTRATTPPNSSASSAASPRSEEHTSELQSPCNLVCRLLLEKKK